MAYRLNLAGPVPYQHRLDLRQIAVAVSTPRDKRTSSLAQPATTVLTFHLFFVQRQPRAKRLPHNKSARRSSLLYHTVQPITPSAAE